MFVFFHDSILQRCMAEEVLFCFLWASAASLIYILHIHILLPTIRHFLTSCSSFHLSMADGRNYNSFGRAQRAILAYILHIFDRNAFRRAIVMTGAAMPFIFCFTHTDCSNVCVLPCQWFESKAMSAVFLEDSVCMVMQYHQTHLGRTGRMVPGHARNFEQGFLTSLLLCAYEGPPQALNSNVQVADG